MAQWTNLQRIGKFLNMTRLCITREKSRGLHLAEPGLTADSRQTGSPADKIWARLEVLKACCKLKYSIIRFLAKVLHCLSNFDALFSGKHFNKVVLFGAKFCKVISFHIDP